jgi:integrase/recombinase XerD
MDTQVEELITKYKRYVKYTYQYKLFLVIKSYSPNTHDVYIRNARIFFASLERDEVDRDTFEKHIKDNKPENTATFNSIISRTNNIIDYTRQNGIFKDPRESFKLNSARNYHRKIPNILSFERIMEVLEELKENKVKGTQTKNTWLKYRDHALIMFLYATGVRVSEAINITIADVQDDQWIRINSGKGAKDRVVPIAKKAISVLKEYIEVCPYDTSKALFLNYMGNKMSRVAIYKVTQKYADISPHKLRHSYATHMYNNGMDLMVLSHLLGHEDIATTEIYLYVENKQLKECIDTHHPINNYPT